MRRHALVPEVAVDLVDAIETAHDEPLEIELRRDAQIQVHVERVVMRDERSCRSAAGNRLHHRRFDLDEPPRVEEVAQRLDDARAEQEHATRIGIDDEVDVSLAVPGLYVLEAVPFLRQRAQSLGEEAPFADADGELSRSRSEQFADGPDVVADVDHDEIREIGELIRARVELDPPRVVHEVQEACLAVVAHRRHASRDTHRLERLQRQVIRGLQTLVQRARPVRHREPVAVRVDAATPEGIALCDGLLERAPFVGHAARSRAHSR